MGDTRKIFVSNVKTRRLTDVTCLNFLFSRGNLSAQRLISYIEGKLRISKNYFRLIVHDQGWPLTDVTRLNFFEVARAALLGRAQPVIPPNNIKAWGPQVSAAFFSKC